MISAEGYDYCEGAWIPLVMKSPNASSRGENDHRKTILDQTSNPRLESSD